MKISGKAELWSAYHEAEAIFLDTESHYHEYSDARSQRRSHPCPTQKAALNPKNSTSTLQPPRLRGSSTRATGFRATVRSGSSTRASVIACASPGAIGSSCRSDLDTKFPTVIFTPI